LGPAFPESHAQHISDLHSKFALGPQRVEVWWTSNLQPLRLGEEKKIERKKPQGKNIMSASATQGGHNKKLLNLVLTCYISDRIESRSGLVIICLFTDNTVMISYMLQRFFLCEIKKTSVYVDNG